MQNDSYSQERNWLKTKLDTMNETDLDYLVWEVYRFQLKYNAIYRDFAHSLYDDPFAINDIHKIPLLPVSAFKHWEVMTGRWKPSLCYSSSTTSGQNPSLHYIHNEEDYLKNTVRGFEQFYGSVSDYCFLALLPGYLERKGSSLIAMMSYFIQLSRFKESGFFLNEEEDLFRVLMDLKSRDIPVILLGVTFALIDFAERYRFDFPGLIVMETGGMKGRRREMTRMEVHSFLQDRWKVDSIHSEYGMTEMMSQAYSQRNGHFKSPATMKVLIKEMTDPLSAEETDRQGIIGVIDLANIDTCAFLLTDDIGRVGSDGTFEILGRMDHSEIRGCNLMVSDI